jgi:hypothetical protein
MAVVDADGDGDLDVLFSGPAPPILMVNDGAGNYASQIVGPSMGWSGSSTIIAVADLNSDGRLEIVVGGQPSYAGWYEAIPLGDYDRNGRVDEADRLLWEQTTGQPATPPGSGADGDRDGAIDDDDLVVWEHHQGERLIPITSPANGNYPPGDEVIDGHDFLVWQRMVGLVAPAGVWAHWDGYEPGVSVVDGGDLEVWKRQYGQGVVPNAAWIFSNPGEAAALTAANEPAVAAAPTDRPLFVDSSEAKPTIAPDVVLSFDAAAAPLVRPRYAPRSRLAFAAARDAALTRRAIEPLQPVTLPWSRLPRRTADEAPAARPACLIDEAFGEL